MNVHVHVHVSAPTTAATDTDSPSDDTLQASQSGNVPVGGSVSWKKSRGFKKIRVSWAEGTSGTFVVQYGKNGHEVQSLDGHESGEVTFGFDRSEAGSLRNSTDKPIQYQLSS